VPVYFNDRQRQATKAARRDCRAERAPASSTSPLQLGSHTASTTPRRDGEQKANGPILVLDWDGGTLDVSILRIEGNSYRVLAVAGDSHLGGADFDCKLADFIAEVLRVLPMSTV